MNSTELDRLYAAARRHLSREELGWLSKKQAPIIGPQGLRRWLVERDIQAFAQLYFGDEFKLDPPPVHLSLITDVEDIRRRSLAGDRGVKLVRALPRGHSKTSWLARITPLHAALFGWSPLTVLLGNNQNAAERLLKNIRDAIVTNTRIAEDFGDVRGEAWGSNRLEFSTGASIYAFGRGSGAIRGVSNPTRPRLIIADDLDDDALVRSAAELEAAEDWWDQAVLPLGDQVGFTTSFLVAGTVIRKTSLLSHVVSSPDFSTVVEQAVKKWSPRDDLWAEWEAQYLDLARQGKQPTSPDDDRFYQEHKAELLEGTQVLWDTPDRYWDLMIRKLVSNSFWGEYQNDPSAANGTMGTLPTVDLPVGVPYWLLAALDPSVKGGTKNDLSAWVEARFYPTLKLIVATRVDAAQRGSGETVEHALSTLRNAKLFGTRYTAVLLENNGAGAVIADQIEERAAAEGLWYGVQRVNNALPKADRVGLLPMYVKRGQLGAVAGIDPELIVEYEQFGSYRYDDVVDALATIVMYLAGEGYLDIAAAAIED